MNKGMDNEGPMDGDPEAQRYGMLSRPIVVGADFYFLIHSCHALFYLIFLPCANITFADPY